MDADVRGVGGNDGFPRPECGGDERQIGERAAEHEVNVSLRAGKACADGLRCRFAVVVAAIAGRGFQIGGLQRCQNGGMRALRIVVPERDHNEASLCFL